VGLGGPHPKKMGALGCVWEAAGKPLPSAPRNQPVGSGVETTCEYAGNASCVTEIVSCFKLDLGSRPASRVNNDGNGNRRRRTRSIY
jgi:hypothetical protein